MTDTLFKQVNFTVSLLIDQIELGAIGLPDIQRPFVWPNTKVRDLFDSMYRGYPVGYLLFWQNAYDGGSRPIGADGKQKTPDLLIVDGQQRLTSLFAVLRGKKVVRQNMAEDFIEISFNPLTGQFMVCDAAIKRDKSFIHNISVLWNGKEDIFELVDSYLEGLRTSRDVTTEDEKTVKKAISRLHSLTSFPFTALELSASIDEEQVAEVFVRVNSKGTPLNQADFILTLMSVFWDEGRAELEQFCREARTPSTGKPSSFNHFLRPDPDQLLRVSVGVGFKRARLQHVYSILRGKDLETGEFSQERRGYAVRRSEGSAGAGVEPPTLARFLQGGDSVGPQGWGADHLASGSSVLIRLLPHRQHRIQRRRASTQAALRPVVLHDQPYGPVYELSGVDHGVGPCPSP
jgi:hypothetical protein